MAAFVWAASIWAENVRSEVPLLRLERDYLRGLVRRLSDEVEELEEDERRWRMGDPAPWVPGAPNWFGGREP